MPLVAPETSGNPLENPWNAQNHLETLWNASETTPKWVWRSFRPPGIPPKSHAIPWSLLENLWNDLNRLETLLKHPRNVPVSQKPEKFSKSTCNPENWCSFTDDTSRLVCLKYSKKIVKTRRDSDIDTLKNKNCDKISLVFFYLY